jgi:hypothetical protein
MSDDEHVETLADEMRRDAAAATAPPAPPVFSPAVKKSPTATPLRISAEPQGVAAAARVVRSPAGSAAGRAPTAAASPLRLAEVQAALACGADGMARALSQTESSWLTPALLARVAREPALAAGLRSPRLAAAVADFARDARGAAAKHAGDAEVLAFFRAFSEVMAEHLSALGGGARAGGAGGAPAAAPSGRVQTPGDLSRSAGAGARIGLTEAAAAAPAAAPADAEVQRVLANETLRGLLADAGTQRLLRECAASPAALRAALAHPGARAKLDLLRAHGLVRFQ